MTASCENSIRLLVITSLCDRPETETYCRLSEFIDIHIFSSPGGPEFRTLAETCSHAEPFDARSASDAEAVSKIRNYVLKHRITAIYAPRTFSLLLAIKAARDLDVRIAGYRGTTGHLGLFDLAPRIAYKNRRVDRIVCVSEAVRQDLLAHGVQQNKPVTIHKGHDISWYVPAHRKQLTDMGVPPDAFVVGFAGRVRRVKGVKYLIKALPMIPDEFKVHLLIAGEVNDMQVRRLLRRACYKNRITLAGFRRDAPSIMGACSAFAMPSIEREGLPRALIEAMAQGVPPVASRTGGIPEIIEDGSSGILTSPGSPGQIAEAIMRLASSKALAAGMGAAARQRIAVHFNIDKTVASMRNLLNNMLTEDR